MPVPYSEDLRWRVVWLHITRGLSYKDISDLLFISEKSVPRFIQRYLNTNSVAPTVHKHGPHKHLTEFEQLTVLQALVVNPSMYLHELCDQLEEVTGKRVHPSTICRTIQYFGMTRQKLRRVALQRSDEKRAEFMAEISQFDPSMLVWLDETGSDRRNTIRAHGYGFRGCTPERLDLRVGGKRISAIAVMTLSGVEDAYISEDNVNGEVFGDFMRRSLLPILQPFNGTNPHSVIIMDNASIHHLEDMITGVGAIIRFLPPYSPDLNPCEEVFAKMKAFLRANDIVYSATMSPRGLCT